MDFQFSGYTILWVLWILWAVGIYVHVLATRQLHGSITWHVWYLVGVGKDERGRVVFSWGRVALITIMVLVSAALTSHWAFGIP